jgi:hypothetical protein
VYLLSPDGQTELTSYRTVKVPSDVEIPEYIKNVFPEFYKALFKTAYQNEGKTVAFVEYAWDMANCDPCSADPLNPEELQKAGVFWQENGRDRRFRAPAYSSVFITRLHVRYHRDRFPEDLQFQSTNNRQSFQGRYVLRHPYKGEMNCEAAKGYQRSVRERQEKEVQTLARLTGWNINEIRPKVEFLDKPNDVEPWWRKLWRQ